MISRILIDTSVWVEHLKKSDPYLIELISWHQENKLIILSHEFIYSELLLGGLDEKSDVYQLLKRILPAKKASLQEFEVFVRNNKPNLQKTGMVDVHLLISCVLTSAKLHTYDKSLKKTAELLGVLHATQ